MEGCPILIQHPLGTPSRSALQPNRHHLPTFPMVQGANGTAPRRVPKMGASCNPPVSRFFTYGLHGLGSFHLGPRFAKHHGGGGEGIGDRRLRSDLLRHLGKTKKRSPSQANPPPQNQAYPKAPNASGLAWSLAPSGGEHRDFREWKSRRQQNFQCGLGAPFARTPCFQPSQNEEGFPLPVSGRICHVITLRCTGICSRKRHSYIRGL